MSIEREGAPSSRWLVYQVEGAPLGPVSSEDIADAILAGALPLDAWVAAPNVSKWLRATDVPVIAQLLAGAPTRRRNDAAATVLAPPVTFDEGTPFPTPTEREER